MPAPGRERTSTWNDDHSRRVLSAHLGADIMIGHHEKLTGEGYPGGVESDAIPLKPG